MSAGAAPAALPEQRPNLELASMPAGDLTPRCSRADSIDAMLQALPSELRGSGTAVVAAGAYGWRELSPDDEVDVVLVGPAPNSAGGAAITTHLAHAGVRPRIRLLTIEQVIAEGRRDLELFAALLASRLICGDTGVYERFLVARRKLARRAKRSLRAELALRYRAIASAEPWQLQHVDVTLGRGGLGTLRSIRLLTLAEAVASRRVELPEDGPAPFAAERDVLLRARTAPEESPAPPAQPREVLLAMRAVDAAALRAFTGERRWKRIASAVLDWQPFGSPPPTAASQATDAQLLLATLEQDDSDTFDSLPPTPWLERILPEWSDVRGLLHRDPTHLHPVDTHLLRTVAEARRATLDESDATGTALVASELDDPTEVLLAALLHGIGEPHGDDRDRAGAVIAERFAARAGFDDETARRLVTVVEHHRLLAAVASRDIGDAAVIQEVAAIAGDAQTLHLLYLVAIADLQATAPETWSPWRGALIRTLYARALEHLEATEQGGESVLALRRDSTLAALSAEFAPTTVARHLDLLPPRYLLVSSPPAIAQHLSLISQAAGGTALRHDPLGDFERLTIVTVDRPGILAAVAGTLAVHDVSVLGGTAYTRDDGVVIDVLHVSDGAGGVIDDARWASITEVLPRALTDDFPIADQLIKAQRSRAVAPRRSVPTTVQVDNAASAQYSVVEVRASDHLGLLYAIAHALHSLSLEIHLAKIDTLGDEVADAFYVVRQNGRRIESPDEIERVCERIIEAIDALDAPPPDVLEER